MCTPVRVSSDGSVQEPQEPVFPKGSVWMTRTSGHAVLLMQKLEQSTETWKMGSLERHDRVSPHRPPTRVQACWPPPPRRIKPSAVSENTDRRYCPEYRTSGVGWLLYRVTCDAVAKDLANDLKLPEVLSLKDNLSWDYASKLPEHHTTHGSKRSARQT